MLIGFGLIGAFLWYKGRVEAGVFAYAGTTWQKIAIWLWIVGAAIQVLSLISLSLTRYVYIVWMTLAFPIGLVMSTVVVSLFYYLLITPIGLVMRMMGRDKLGLKPKPIGESYWVKKGPPPPKERYLRQH